MIPSPDFIRAVPSPRRHLTASLRVAPALLALALAGCTTTPAHAPEDAQLLIRDSAPAMPTARPLPLAQPEAARPSGGRRPALPQQPIPPGHRIPHAAPDTQSNQGNAQEDGVTLNFVDADLAGVVRAMARFTGRNFVVDPRIKGNLTLVSEQPVPPATAYAMLLGALRMQGFAVVEVDGISRVVPEADAKLHGSPVSVSGETIGPGDGLVTRVFPLRYETAASMVPVLRPMIAPNNPITAYPGNNTLVITDYADNLERIAQVIAEIDTPVSINTDVLPIRHGIATDIAGLIMQLLSSDGGGANDASQRVAVVADPRTNSLLLKAGSPARLQMVRNLALQIDNPETKFGNMHVVYLRNAQATRLAEVLRGLLSGQSSTTGSGTTTLSGGLSGQGSNTTALNGNANDSNASNLGSASAGTSLIRQPGPSTQAFSAGGATIQADQATNTLLISAPEPLYRDLREIIDQLDQRRAQVLVESLIVEVNADNNAEFGIQWMTGGSRLSDGGSGFIGGTNLGGSGLSLGSSTATGLDALGSGLSLGVVKGSVNILGQEIINLGVLARAMESTGNANVLSTPNLMTLDNEEASIVVGRTVPFVTGQYTTAGDGQSNPFQTIQREDVGLTLRLRPQISEGGTVQLTLYQEVSSIDSSASLSTAGLVTRKRALETNVLVDDGQIIVLGGLLEENVTDTTVAVPLLSKLPWLGNLFRYDRKIRSKTNLMVFLRPHIVRDGQDSANLTLNRYNYMRTIQQAMPQASHWLMPDARNTILPALDRQPDGLLDLRGPTPAPTAPAAPATLVTPVTPVTPATPQPGDMTP